MGAHQSDLCVSLCVCVCVCARYYSLLGLGGNQQPQGASYAEGLVDHGLHLRERPEEQQVFVDGKDLPAYLQAGHLGGQTDRQERGRGKRKKRCYF